MKRIFAGLAALAVVVAGAIGVQRSVVSMESPSKVKSPTLKSGYDGRPKVNSEDNIRDLDRQLLERQAEDQAKQQQKALAELQKQTWEQAAADIDR